MLLIIEIILTVKAFRKGWGWKALIPGSLIVLLAVIMGVVAAAQGMTDQQLHTMVLYMVPFEWLMIGVVAWMARTNPETQAREEKEIAEEERIELPPSELNVIDLLKQYHIEYRKGSYWYNGNAYASYREPLRQAMTTS